MLNPFQYDFVVRGLIAGIVIAISAPIIGIFLVLRRYSLIADTLSHVSFAGIAIGFLLGINPLLSATLATVASSVFMEKLRNSRKVYGESALALFLSGSLAFAIIVIGISRRVNSTLFNYLFGSIATVTTGDIVTVFSLSLFVIIITWALFDKLLFVTFDEEAARVAGVRVSFINTVFAVLSAATISLSIPVVGVLLISALLVIPVICALQFRRSFFVTILIAEVISVIAVVTGVLASFYLNLATGGTIVMITIVLFFVVSYLTRKR